MTIIRVGAERTFKTINEAYLLSSSGDTLWIDEGVYEEKLVMDSKYVNLVGHTSNPGFGKVIITPPADNNAIYFLNISTNVTIYIENLYLKLTLDSPSTTDTELIEVLNCSLVDLVFNRCILDATVNWEYVFDCNESLGSMNLYNCRVIWKDDYVFNTSGATHFERASHLVPYIIDKCIMSNELENIDASFFTQQLPYNYFDNELSIYNTTASSTGPLTMENLYKAFDNYYTTSNTYATWSESDESATLYFYTDFGEGNEKNIVFFRIVSYSSIYMNSITLHASSDNINWIKLYGEYRGSSDSSYYASQLENSESYRYYKLTINKREYYDQVLLTSDYTLATPNQEYTPFDYVLNSNKKFYGPSYGSSKNYVPTEYCFEGTITDVLSENKKFDTITFDVYNKSSNITLSTPDYLNAYLYLVYDKSHHTAIVTLGRCTGKWYWEVLSYDYKGLSKNRVGVGTGTTYLNDAVGGSDNKSMGYEIASGDFYKAGEVVKTGASGSKGDIIGIALDLDNGKIWWSKNGVWLLEGNPELGLNPIFEDVKGTLYPMVSLYNSGYVTIRLDLRINPDKLVYEIPHGFEFYSTSVVWKIKYFNQETNELLGYTYSDPIDSSYYITTTYSGPHFLICEDAESSPNYNDLIFSNLIPKELF